MTSIKLLKTIFIILLLGIISELFYYVYIQSSVKNNYQPEIRNTAVKSTKQISNDELINSVDNCTLGKMLYKSIKTEKSSTDALIDTKTIEYLKTFKKNNNQKVTLVLEIKGNIGDIIYHEGGYALLKLVDNEGKNITDVSIRVNENKPIFFSIINNKKLPLSLKEIKKGDRVIYKSQIDMSNTQVSNYEFIVY